MDLFSSIGFCIVVIIIVVIIFLVFDDSPTNHNMTTERSNGSSSIYVSDPSKNGRIVARSSGRTVPAALDRLIMSEYGKAIDCTRASAIKRHLDIMNTALDEAKAYLPQSEILYYQGEIADIQSEYNNALQEEKQDKAIRAVTPKMDAFLTCYDAIVQWNYKTCDRGLENKKKCLKLRKELLEKAKRLSCLKDVVDELRIQMSDEKVLPENEDQLIAVLDGFIERMKPEGKRKMKTIKEIMDYVPKEGTIQRSDLLAKPYDGASQKEIDICYKQLIERKKLLEEKKGNRYHVFRVVHTKNTQSAGQDINK